MPSPMSFDDADVRRVLARAAELSVAPAQDGRGGMSLADLEQIGREAGLSPEAIAQAVLEVRHGADAPTVIRSWGGIPYGLSRIVTTTADVDDAVWDRVVRVCRQTFEALGESTSAPGLRVWQNGNLRVVIERVTGGHRISLTTRKAAAGWASIIGISWVSTFGGLGALLAATGAPTAQVLGMVALGLPGVLGVVGELMQLRRWARTRAAQFALVASQLPALLAERPANTEPTTTSPDSP